MTSILQNFEGTLVIPDQATGLVLFAHGSGSSRHSPRNVYVAEVLNAAGIGTFLFDLLTPAEELYIPQTERQSHYFHAILSKQFDAVIHLDETRALEPLEKTDGWTKSEFPETYPSGV